MVALMGVATGVEPLPDAHRGLPIVYPFASGCERVPYPVMGWGRRELFPSPLRPFYKGYFFGG